MVIHKMEHLCSLKCKLHTEHKDNFKLNQTDMNLKKNKEQLCYVYALYTTDYKGYCTILFDLNLRCTASNCYWCSLGAKYLDNPSPIFPTS